MRCIWRVHVPNYSVLKGDIQGYIGMYRGIQRHMGSGVQGLGVQVLNGWFIVVIIQDWGKCMTIEYLDP